MHLLFRVGGSNCISAVMTKIFICDESRIHHHDAVFEGCDFADCYDRIAHNVKNAPFNLVGFVGSAFHPMKKCLHALLWALASDKYDASEWIFNIMSDAWKRTVASE